MGGTELNPVLSPEHIFIGGILLLLASAWLAWISTARLAWRPRVACMGLRMMALLAIVLLLLNPGGWKQLREEIDQRWAIAIDRSSSMAKACPTAPTRWKQAVAWAKEAASLAKKPGGLETYTFDTMARPVMQSELTSLNPDGSSTDIPGAGKNILATFEGRGQKLRGLLLISDGRQIEKGNARNLALRAKAQGCVIYTMAVKGVADERDFSLSSRRTQYIGFPGQEVVLPVKVKSTGFGPSSPTIELLDSTDKTVSTIKVDLTEELTQAEALFRVKHDEPGSYDYRIRIKPWEGETNPYNNEVPVALTVIDSDIRIFFAEGAPYWDSKFLAQHLRHQKNTEVTAVYRVSKKRFYKISSDAQKAEETTEAIFPSTSEKLSHYDMIILGKGAEYFLTPERIALLENFISEQGGSLIFARSKAYHGEFPALQKLEPLSWGKPIEEEFKLTPTPFATDMEVFADMVLADDSPVWQKLPLLKDAHKVEQLNSFSQVLADGVYQTSTKRRTFPAVVSRRYGKGLVITINADGLWRWDFTPPGLLERNMYEEFWRQLVQWAMMYSEFLPGSQYSLRLSKQAADVNEPVRATIRQRGTAPAGQTLRLEVRKGGQPVQTVQVAQGQQNQATRREAVFSLSEAGSYTVHVVSDAEKKDPNKTASTQALQIRPLPTEADDTRCDAAFLNELASLAGGRLIGQKELATVVAGLEPDGKAVRMSKPAWHSNWDQWWLLPLLLALLSGDWLIRRRNGLL